MSGDRHEGPPARVWGLKMHLWLSRKLLKNAGERVDMDSSLNLSCVSCQTHYFSVLYYKEGGLIGFH